MYFGEDGDVGWDKEGGSSQVGDFLDDSLGFGGVGGDVVYADVVAVLGEAEGDGFTAGEVREMDVFELVEGSHPAC